VKTAAPVEIAPAIALPLTRAADYLQLCRPRMAVMILLTVAIGGLLAAVGPAPVALGHAVLGTALVTAAASMLNQYLERDTDALMPRTANRPLPAGRLAPNEVLFAGVVAAAVGLGYLALTAPEAALVCATTFGLYVFLYTPAKKSTTLNTLIGAVPGALPPVIGWVAVRGRLDGGALALFLIVFVWQVPHFLAIAWMYRDDYAQGGLDMLTVRDRHGLRTAQQMLLYGLTLVPVSLTPVLGGQAGPAYAGGALLLGAYFLRSILRFRRERSVPAARAVLRSSLIYLPALLMLLLASKYLLPG
jgi:protoheme IX farnesyltransferase